MVSYGIILMKTSKAKMGLFATGLAIPLPLQEKCDFEFLRNRVYSNLMK